MCRYQSESEDVERPASSRSVQHKHTLAADWAEQTTKRNIRPLSAVGDARAHAAFLRNGNTLGTPRATRSILQLQRTHGNRYVQRVLSLAKQGDSEGEVTSRAETAHDHDAPQLSLTATIQRQDGDDQNFTTGQQDGSETTEDGQNFTPSEQEGGEVADGGQNFTPVDQDGGGMTVNPLAKSNRWGLSAGGTLSVAAGAGLIYMLLGLKNLDTGCYSTLRFAGAGLGLEEHALTLACGTEYSEFTTGEPVDFPAFNAWGSVKILGGGIGVGGSMAFASFQGVDTDPGQIDIGGCEVGIPDVGGGIFEGKFTALSVRLPDGSPAFS